MTNFKELEKHVLDDAIELIASVGVGNPLMHTTRLHEMAGTDKEVAIFLRSVLGRHVVLVLTRLHALKGPGPTGETASIDSYLDHAETEGRLPAAKGDEFRYQRRQIIARLEKNGIKFSELRDFRNVELAHSLHPWKPLTNKLLSLPIWDFASDTFELVRAIERAVSGTGRLDREFQDWLDRGRCFWAEPDEGAPFIDFETAGRT
jgi:hypothetical protein